MKQNKEKQRLIRDCIKSFYLSVSDSKIAIKFAVPVQQVAKARRKLGLKKTPDVIKGLKVKMPYKRNMCS